MQNETSFPERGINELFSELWSVYLARVVRLVVIAFVSAVIIFGAVSGIDAILPEGNEAQINAILATVPEGQLPTEEQSAEIGQLQLDDIPLDLLELSLVLIATVSVSALAAGAYMFVIGAHYVVGRVLISEALAFAVARAGALLVTTVMAMGTVFAVWAVLFFVPFVVANAMSDVELLLVLFGLLSFTGLVGAVVITVYVLIRWTFVWPVVAFDGLIGVTALRRSWQLTEGFWWRTFGILIIVALAVFAVQFPSVIFAAAGLETVDMWYSNLVAPTVAGPIQAIMIFLLNADLRTRKETPPGYGPDQIAQELGFQPQTWDDAP